ncbi:MAG: anti-sigma factor family protein [Bryobacteraceae bacterium]
MKRCPSLEDLALFVGGDIDAAAVTDIEAHAAGCDECRKRVGELQEDREFLRTPPTIPEPAYMQVRSSVLSDLQRRQRRGYLWATAAAAALLFACLLPLSIRRTAPLPQTMAPTASLRPPPPPQRRLNVAIKPRVAVKKKPLSPRPALPSENTKLFEALDALLETKEERGQTFSGSVMVELKTQDPNVTIILLEESTGGAE